MQKKREATKDLRKISLFCVFYALILTGFMRSMRWILVLILFATACRAKSPDYFLSRGRTINHELLEQMQGVDDLDALIEALPRMQKLYGELVDLIIEAKKWQNKHKTTWQPTEEDRALSLELAQELARLYELPSARALIEKSQETALLRLDSFQKK